MWRSGGLRDGAILSDMPPRWPIPLSRTARDMDAHARSHVVSLGGALFHQRNGVPQGSVVSTLLCNLYYGRIERCAILPRIAECMRREQSKVQAAKGGWRVVALLMRLTDDWLLLTNCQPVADCFKQLVETGYPLAGCQCKKSKTVVVSADHSASSSERGGEATRIPWCGLSIQCNGGLAVRQDLRRLVGDEAASRLHSSRREDQAQAAVAGTASAPEGISSRPAPAIEASTTLSEAMLGDPASMLRKYADGYIRPWRRPLFLDPTAHGIRETLLNAGEIAALATAKLIAILRRCPQAIRARVGSEHLKIAIVHMADVLASVSEKCIKLRMAPRDEHRNGQRGMPTQQQAMDDSEGASVASSVSLSDDVAGRQGNQEWNGNDDQPSQPLLLCGAHLAWCFATGDLVPAVGLSSAGEEPSSDAATEQLVGSDAQYATVLGAALGVKPGYMNRDLATAALDGTQAEPTDLLPLHAASGIGSSIVAGLVHGVATFAGAAVCASAPLDAARRAHDSLLLAGKHKLSVVNKRLQAPTAAFAAREDACADTVWAVRAACGGASECSAVAASVLSAGAGNKSTPPQTATATAAAAASGTEACRGHEGLAQSIRWT